jgi:hypothetical protein
LEKYARDPQIFLKCPLKNLISFSLILLLNILGWTQPNHLGWDETSPTQLTWSQPSDHVNYIRVLHAK